MTSETVLFKESPSCCSHKSNSGKHHNEAYTRNRRHRQLRRSVSKASFDILPKAKANARHFRGLEADQKVIAAHGCYAMTAQAALTAQNTQGVKAIHEVPSEFVKQQIDACVEDIGVDVVKTGMLASASTISIVADALKRHRISLSVIDPVMVATTGAQLLPEKAVKTLCDELLKETFILTPNIPEANMILKAADRPSVEVEGLEDLKMLAAAVLELGPRYVLLKGGHIPLTSEYKVARSDEEKAVIVNVLVGDGVQEVIESKYQNSRNTHGTGCSLACKYDLCFPMECCRNVLTAP